jgi:hypothetical protein
MPNGPADSTVERLFANFLDRRERGEAADIETFCAGHPEQAGELRLLYADHERVQSELQQAARAANRDRHTADLRDGVIGCRPARVLED